jgi:hypothetical protein
VAPPPGCRLIEVAEDTILHQPGGAERVVEWVPWVTWAAEGCELDEHTRARVLTVGGYRLDAGVRAPDVLLWAVAAGPIPPTCPRWLPPAWLSMIYPLGDTPAHHAAWAAHAAGAVPVGTTIDLGYDPDRVVLPDDLRRGWRSLVADARRLAHRAGLTAAPPPGSPMPTSRQEARAELVGIRDALCDLAAEGGQGRANRSRAVTTRLRPSEVEMLRELRASGEPLQALSLANKLGTTEAAIRQRARRLLRLGLIRNERGDGYLPTEAGTG